MIYQNYVVGAALFKIAIFSCLAAALKGRRESYTIQIFRLGIFSRKDIRTISRL